MGLRIEKSFTACNSNRIVSLPGHCGKGETKDLDNELCTYRIALVNRNEQQQRVKYEHAISRLQTTHNSSVQWPETNAA